MAETVKIDQLSATIAEELSKYSQEVVEKVNVSGKKAGQAAVRQLKKTSPKRDGDYAKGWRLKTIKGVGQTDKYIVHNATDYQLTHLLEKGHAKVNGGRVEGIPHIAPAEDMVIREFTAQVEEAIRSG